MMTFSRFFVPLLLAALCLSAYAQKPRKLDSKSKSAIKKAMARYVKTPVDDKPELLPEFMRHGRLGIEFLETLKKKKGYSGDIALIKHRARTMLGFDLLERQKAKEEDAYHPNYFAYGELVLLRRGQTLAGLRVSEALDATDGRISVEVWRQDGRGKSLAQPGGLHETKTLDGKKCARSLKPNSAYDEYEFDVPIGDLGATLRFVGPAYFLIKFQADVEIAVEGFRKPEKVKSPAKLSWIRDAGDLSRARELLQAYLFRAVPGCEPLQLTEEEREAFAQYEAVQIESRRARPGGSPIVLVKFPEPGGITYTELEDAYLRNFVRELLPVRDEHILVTGGSSSGYEGNHFWLDGEWKRPTPALVKVLRTNFVEDY